MMSSELGENLFSRSEANKLALSRSDIASELSGLRNGGILFFCFVMFFVAFRNALVELFIEFK
jgi:hypothetical protein